MKTLNSLLHGLLQGSPHLRCQVYFKASLTALSHAMEDLVLVGTDKPLVIANFQQERFYRQESRRYHRIAQRTDQVYILAAPESNFAATLNPYVTVPLNPEDTSALYDPVLPCGSYLLSRKLVGNFGTASLWGRTLCLE